MLKIEEDIGYSFKNREYLEVALTHSSYANERRCKDNERLEFLGDSVLSLIVSENLFLSFAGESEGDLSKTRSALVCEGGLFELSRKINLAKYIRLGKGEEMSGGRKRPSVISDAFEALLAAIFLDSDFETAKKWLLGIMKEELAGAGNMEYGDYKTALQERTQKGNSGVVSYKLVGEHGPDHNKVFECAVMIDGRVAAQGMGKTKKEAEQNAAKEALAKL